jgi:hypothetical protein
MRVIVEQLVEWRLAGETEVLGENLPQRHFVHHKSHLTKVNALTPWRHIREWRCSSIFLDLGIRWRWVVSFTPLPLYPRHPLDRSWVDAVKKRQILHCRETNPGRSASSRSLYRLSYPNSFLSVDSCCRLRQLIITSGTYTLQNHSYSRDLKF